MTLKTEHPTDSAITSTLTRRGFVKMGGALFVSRSRSPRDSPPWLPTAKLPSSQTSSTPPCSPPGSKSEVTIRFSCAAAGQKRAPA